MVLVLSFLFKSKYLNWKPSPLQDFLALRLCFTGMTPGVVIYFCLILANSSWRSSYASKEPFFSHMATCVGEPIIALKVPDRERNALSAWNNLFSSGVNVHPGHGSSFFHLFDKARKIAWSTPVLQRRWKRCLKAVCVPNTDLQSISCRTLYYSYNPFRHACVPQKGFCERTMNHFATMSDCQHACSSGPSRVPGARTARNVATRIKLRIQRESEGVTTTLVNSTLKLAKEKSLLLIGYILPEPTHGKTSVATSKKTSRALTSKHSKTTQSATKDNALSNPATQPSGTLADYKLNPSTWPQWQPKTIPPFSRRALPALGLSPQVTDSFGKYLNSYRDQVGPMLPAFATVLTKAAAKNPPGQVAAQSPVPNGPVPDLQLRSGTFHSFYKNPLLRQRSSDSTNEVPAHPVQQTATASAANTPSKTPETRGAITERLQGKEEQARLAGDGSSRANKLSRPASPVPPLWAYPLVHPIHNLGKEHPKEVPRREPVVEERIVPKTAPQTGIRTLQEYPMRGRSAASTIEANPRYERSMAQGESWEPPHVLALPPPFSPGTIPAIRF